MVRVLILVLMEDGLGQHLEELQGVMRSLNPCFNGRWSRTGVNKVNSTSPVVLILVLMEDGLGPHVAHGVFEFVGLNPCFNGRWSRTAKSVIFLII